MKKLIGTAIVLLSFMAGTYAQAGSDVFVSYNTTVGAFNGSGYTGYQTKDIAGAAGEIYNTSVGGGYSVDARQVSSSSSGTWTRDISGNSTIYRYLYNSIPKGSSTRVQFSNDLNTPVSVQVTGQFRSN